MPFEPTALRVALWRALHLEVDAKPPVFQDDCALELADPDPAWRQRPDMHPEGTKPFRASILARARYIEDLLSEHIAQGVSQYVILGAGLDTFGLRFPERLNQLTLFEMDRPEPLAWKDQRLASLGIKRSRAWHFVPVNFEQDESWLQKMNIAGFEASQKAVISCLGVSMYLTREAITALLQQAASLAKGSVLAMSFLLPIELAEAEVRPGIERAVSGARMSGTPFISFFRPGDLIALARKAGLSEVRHISAAHLAETYFRGRTDGLRPALNTEELLIAYA